MAKLGINFLSSEWRAIEMYLVDRIQELREKNDALTNSVEETNQIRGQILAYKALLALSKAPTPPLRAA